MRYTLAIAATLLLSACAGNSETKDSDESVNQQVKSDQEKMDSASKALGIDTMEMDSDTLDME